ncbi:MAG: hypothetical protein ACYC5X_15185, partial [Syntrophales bacterium]
DLQKTYTNTVTSTYLQRGMIPIIGGTDRETIQMGADSIPLVRADQLKVAWIRNTNEIEYIALSPAALPRCGTGVPLEPLSDIDWAFDEKDLLLPWAKE